MFVASASTSIKIHELPRGCLVHNYQPGSKADGPIRSISWSKDGVWLAAVPQSGLAEIISRKGEKLKLIHIIQDVAEPSCAAFQNNTKKYLALGTKNGQVLVYDVKSRGIKKRFPRAPGIISRVCFSAKDGHCVAACENGDVIVYSCVTNGQSASFKVPRSNSVNALKTHLLKRQLIGAGSNEGVVAVWDIHRGTSLFSVDAHVGPVTSMAFSPVSSDLVLTAGMDRMFKFYDFADRNCVSVVQTDNCLTAVDFYEDGKYFVTASQNGKVSLYDSRNIQHPWVEFEAHQSCIKHVAFQNLSDDNKNKSSFCSITAENLDMNRPIVAEDVNKRTSDFFGMFIQAPPECDMVDIPSTKTNTSVSMEGGDSFIVAMGLDKNDSVHVDSLKDEDVRKSVSREGKAFSRISSRLSDFRKTSSTPKFPGLHLDDASPAPAGRLASHPEGQVLSPVVAIGRPSAAPGGPTLGDDIRDAVRDAVRAELKDALDDVRQEVKFQTMHVAQQLRRMIIDLQMAMVREFIKVENYCNNIRDEITGNSSTTTESELMEENESLRRRIAYLESQMSTMAVIQSNSQVSKGQISQNESNST